MPVNEFDQPVGESLDWAPRTAAPIEAMVGTHVRLVPLSARHAEDLWQSLVLDSPDSLWTYLFSGPFERTDVGRQAFDEYVEAIEANPDFEAYCVELDGKALGHACLMRDVPTMGVIEVGNIALGERLQRTTAATEMIYLLARNVFEVRGYRRFEWKCDSFNEPSRRAAERFGFSYEGRFRQAVVYKGRNRDTDWFAMTDSDWHTRLRAAYDAWLEPTNFDADGNQLSRLRTT